MKRRALRRAFRDVDFNKQTEYTIGAPVEISVSSLPKKERPQQKKEASDETGCCGCLSVMLAIVLLLIIF